MGFRNNSSYKMISFRVKQDEEEVMMMPHMDDVDIYDFESTNHLIPRKTFSVISIQRPFGSRASLASRKRSMMFDQLRGRMAKKQLDFFTCKILNLNI